MRIPDGKQCSGAERGNDISLTSIEFRGKPAGQKNAAAVACSIVVHSALLFPRNRS